MRLIIRCPVRPVAYNAEDWSSQDLYFLWAQSTATDFNKDLDLDALPVPDLKDVKYRSLNEGIMHACGHDVHMTVVMTIARLIAERPPTKGRI
jgi:hypothetical protein